MAIKGRVRPVRLADAAAVARIYNEYVVNTTISFEICPVSVEEMECRIHDISSVFPFFVYETENGCVIGYCYAHKWKERAAYNETVETTIYCSSTYQSKGIGSALMQELVSECKRMGYYALIACITGDNHNSIRFHQKFGFKKVSHFEKVGTKFGQKLDVCDFELLLK